jgi:hypothetical protein
MRNPIEIDLAQPKFLCYNSMDWIVVKIQSSWQCFLGNIKLAFKKFPDSVCIFRIDRPARSGLLIELRSPRSEIMSPSLHILEVYHAVAIGFLDLRHDLLVGCASEPEEMDDRMDFDIHKDV